MVVKTALPYSTDYCKHPYCAHSWWKCVQSYIKLIWHLRVWNYKERKNKLEAKWSVKINILVNNLPLEAPIQCIFSQVSYSAKQQQQALRESLFSVCPAFVISDNGAGDTEQWYTFFTHFYSSATPLYWYWGGSTIKAVVGNLYNNNF